MHYSNMHPQNTYAYIKTLFGQSLENVIKKIRRNYDKVNEELITYTLSLEFRDTILKKVGDLKNKLIQDVITFLSTKSVYNNISIRNYYTIHLCVDLILHERRFEGEISKSDYGLLLSIPLLTYDLNSEGFKIKYLNRGILIQAKRNFSAKNSYTHFGKVNFSKVGVSIIKNFYSLSLYKFEVEDQTIKLNKIVYEPISKNLSDEEFKMKVNEILSKPELRKELNSNNFLDELFNGDIGTKDEQEIQKYILDGPFRTIEIRFYFDDDGTKLESVLKNVNNKNTSIRQLVLERCIGCPESFLNNRLIAAGK